MYCITPTQFIYLYRSDKVQMIKKRFSPLPLNVQVIPMTNLEDLEGRACFITLERKFNKSYIYIYKVPTSEQV